MKIRIIQKRKLQIITVEKDISIEILTYKAFKFMQDVKIIIKLNLILKIN